MARNFWDEMGRGSAKGMHGPMLERLASFFGLAPTPDTVVPEALALGNTMIALARHRRYAFHSVGALGVIEMTAPGRAALVDAALRRLRTPAKKRHYSRYRCEFGLPLTQSASQVHDASAEYTTASFRGSVQRA